jgi:hypothetical protein
VLFPVRMHPGSVSTRWPAPFPTHPHPAAAVQIPKSICPNVARTRRVANRSDNHRRGRRRNRIANVRLRCAGSQRGGCKHHTGEYSLFDLHEKAFHIRLDWRAVLTGFVSGDEF